MSIKKPTAAEAVYEWLGTNPGSHTLDELTAALPEVKKATLTKALTGLVDDDQIRTADHDGVAAWTADPNGDEASDAEGATTPRDEHEAVAQGPNPQVIAVAFVLGRAASGMTVDDLATGSGIGVDALWPVLAAMHTAGAADCDRGFILDPEAVWTAGAADPMTVTLSGAPDTVRCPMCGNQAPVPGRKARKRSNGGGNRAAGQYEPVRDMGEQVDAWLKRHPDQDVTPGQISKALKDETGHPNPNAYSSGAIRNVLFKLVNRGELREVSGAPRLTFHTPATGS